MTNLFDFPTIPFFILFGKSSKENKKIKRKNEPVKGQTNPSMRFPHPFLSFSLLSSLCTSPSPALFFSSSIAKGTSFRPQFSLPFVPQQWSTESRWHCLLSPMDLAKNSLWSICNFFFIIVLWVQFYEFFIIIIILMSPVLWFFFLSNQTLL